MSRASRVFLSVIIVSHDSRRHLERCLASLEEPGALPEPSEVFLVDNASGDGTADWVARAHPRVTLIRNAGNLGFARACNQALGRAAGRLVLFLNPDTEVAPGALEALAALLDARPEAGLVSPRLTGDGPPAWGLTPTLPRLLLGRFRRHARPEPPEGPVDWLLGACLMGRAAELRELGGFDEDYFLYGEDLDLCQRVADAGREVVYCPSLAVFHEGNSRWDSARLSRVYAALLMFYRKHRSLPEYLCLRAGMHLVLSFRRLRDRFCGKGGEAGREGPPDHAGGVGKMENRP